MVFLQSSLLSSATFIELSNLFAHLAYFMFLFFSLLCTCIANIWATYFADHIVSQTSAHRLHAWTDLACALQLFASYVCQDTCGGVWCLSLYASLLIFERKIESYVTRCIRKAVYVNRSRWMRNSDRPHLHNRVTKGTEEKK